MCLKLYSTILLSVLFLNSVHGQQKSRQKCVQYISHRSKRGVNVPQVVGGIETENDEFPHMAALGFANKGLIEWSCGGTLISDQFILTAAHCTKHRELGDVKTVRLGATILSKKDGVDYEVAQIIKHPNYKPPLQYNDIALLKLSKKVTFSNKILPACLNSGFDVTRETKTLTALGWGYLDFTGPKAEKLMKVVLRKYSHSQCNNAYRNTSKRKLSNGIRDNSQFCAGGAKGETKDTCQGDSGGPLEYRIGNFHYIVGITSFGKACGIDGTPGVYTRVSAFIKWVERIVWP